MINYLNPALKPFLLVLAVTLLFSGCKKDELTVTELGNMAAAKLKEIEVLSTDIPCSQQTEVSVQEISTGCSIKYYPVKAADQAKFSRLKKEYFDLLGKQADAMVKQGVIIDPCYESIWISEQPIRLECKTGKVELITSGNVGIEEAKTLATQCYDEIRIAVNAQTCTSGSEWLPTALIKDKMMEVEFIPYLRTQDFAAFKKKVSLYNRLKARVIEAQGPVDFVRNELKVERIDCINGKPVVKLGK